MGDKMGNRVGNNSENGEAVRLNETQRKILDEIRNNPNITKEQLSIKICKGKTTIDNGIKFLRENGRLRRIGSNKNGYWEVMEA